MKSFGSVLAVDMEKTVNGSKIFMCEQGKNLYARGAGELKFKRNEFARIPLPKREFIASNH